MCIRDRFVRGPVDPGASRPAAGIACLGRLSARIAELTPLTRQFDGQHDEGRAMLFVCDLCVGTP
eukprot:8095263-Alexandrium_andersonii.AAC.1